MCTLAHICMYELLEAYLWVPASWRVKSRIVWEARCRELNSHRLPILLLATASSTGTSTGTNTSTSTSTGTGFGTSTSTSAGADADAGAGTWQKRWLLLVPAFKILSNIYSKAFARQFKLLRTIVLVYFILIYIHIYI